MDKLKINFKYFPREARKEDNFFLNLLEKNFDYEIREDADFVFFSTFTRNKKEIPLLNTKATKIFWTGENINIDMKKCDYAFGFEYENEINNKKYMRLPLYAYYGAGKNLIKEKSYNPSKILSQKEKFCAYIYSKDAKERVEFFNKLNKYKKIDSPGKSMNNCPPIIPKRLEQMAKPLQFIEKKYGKYPISALISRHSKNWTQDKIDYLKNYKFTIAFENSEKVGYTTEKIYHPMLANSIPIYWGNPEISRDFNTKSFVNYYDYNDLNKVIDKIIEIDTDKKIYLKMLSEPWFKRNKPNKWCGEERIVKQLENIFKTKARK